MAPEILIRELDDGGRRGINKAAGLAEEQLQYALAIARKAWPAQAEPDPVLVAALLQAIAINFAAVK